MEIVVGLAEIPDGGAKTVEARPGLKIALFRVQDRAAAINNRCPHASASLGEGDFDGFMSRFPTRERCKFGESHGGGLHASRSDP